MKYDLIILDSAEAELVEAEDWYEAKRPGLGIEFRLAIEEAIDYLVEWPLAAPPLLTVPEELGVRHVPVKRFPYSVVFMPRDNEVWVIAFAHHSRRPGYWRERRNKVK